MSAKEVAERPIEIRNPEGLHMRPAMRFVQRANMFQSRITLSKGNQNVDGKSIMQVTMLAASKGTRLLLRAEGQDAHEAAEILARLLENETSDEPVS